MAAPLNTAKQAVDLAAPGVRVSRIRRDPPPVETKTVVMTRSERDRRTVLIGIAASALFLVIILSGLASYSGWTPREYTAHL